MKFQIGAAVIIDVTNAEKNDCTYEDWVAPYAGKVGIIVGIDEDNGSPDDPFWLVQFKDGYRFSFLQEEIRYFRRHLMENEITAAMVCHPKRIESAAILFKAKEENFFN